MASRLAIAHARTLARGALACLVSVALVLLAGPGIARASAPVVDSAGTPETAASGMEQVSATVDPGGLDTTVSFQYGPDTNYGTTVAAGSIAGSAGVTTVTALIGPLTAGSTYHVQAVVSNENYNGVTGPDQTFVAGVPDVTTDGATTPGGSNSSQTINGTINPGGTATGYFFQYGAADGVESEIASALAPSLQLSAPPAVSFDDSTLLDTPVVSLSSSAPQIPPTPVSATLTGLAPGSYQYTLVAESPNGQGGYTYVDGATNTFVVGFAQATTGSATQDAIDGAVVNGTVNPTGVPTTYHFDYGTTTAYGLSTTELDAGSGTTDEPETATLTNLSAGSVYHYRIVATTAAGPFYGADETFTLNQSFADTTAPTGLTSTGVTLNGILGAGGLTTTYWFQYSSDGSYDEQTQAQTAASASGSPQSESATVVLTPGLVYTYRLVVSNAGGTFYGQPQSIRGEPQIDSYPATTPVDDNDVTLHSDINPNGLDTTVQYEYGTSSGSYGAPVPASPIDDGSGDSDVDAPDTLGSLTPGTLYYYRVIATNSAGTVTGAEQTFTSPTPPDASAEPATNVVANAAVLNGDVTANGDAGTYYFEYGTTTQYGQTVPSQPASYPGTASDLPLSAQVTGLAASTTYYYAIVASDGVAADTAVSSGQFTTAATDPPPVPGTPTVTSASVTDTKATVQASLDPNGQDTGYYFEYETTAQYNNTGCGGTATAILDGGTASVDETVTADLSGLTPGTSYTVCLVATWAGNQTAVSASGVAFTTFTPPTPTTGGVSATGITTATLTGSENPNGFATQAYFQYGTSASYGFTTTPQDVSTGSSTVAVTPVGIANLVPSTTYHYRLVATNGVDTADGADMTFTTDAAPQPPAFTDPGPSGVDDCDATINALVNPEGQATTWSVQYGTTTGYGTTVQGGPVGSGTSPVTVSVSLGDAAPPCSENGGPLSADTLYHYQILATNNTGTTIEADQTFMTFTPPSVTTGAAAAPGSSTVALNASVNPNGFATTYSFQYGLDQTYGSTSSSASVGSGTSAQSVSLSIGSLLPDTTYHFRAVATNGPDTTYGADQTFTTTALPPPSASTETSSGITATGATISAVVNPLGQATTYQFEYGADLNYGSTTALQSVGSGALPQTAEVVLTGLAPSTTYHFRVIAASASGSTTGSDATFTTLAAPSASAGGSSGGSGSTTGSGSSSGSGSASGSGGASAGGSGHAGGSGAGSPGGTPKPPTLTVRSAPVERVSSGKVTLDTGVRVSCPVGGPSCTVSIPVAYVVTRTVPAKGHKRATVTKVTKTLVSVSESIAPGQALEATVPLSAKVLAVVAAARRLKSTARVSAWASGGTGRTLPISVTLTPAKAPKAPGKKHH